jgi:hypothetical protein
MNKPKFSRAGVLNVDFQIQFKNKMFKSVLNKLKRFLEYNATVGIHYTDGLKQVIRRYTTMSKNGTKSGHYAGKSHRMNIVKLAYQNEFGANITIKPKYKTVTHKIKSEVNTLHHRITTTTIEKYSALRNAKQQGYLLLDKKGNFVAYFKPDSVISIPARPFLRKVITNLDPALQSGVQNVLANTFIKKGLSASKAFKTIASLVKCRVQANIHVNNKANHPITVKAKGKNSPLVDEQDRLAKSIKYKIYRGSKGAFLYKKQKNFKVIDKTLKSIQQFEDKGIISRETLDPVKKDFEDKINPRFGFKDY